MRDRLSNEQWKVLEPYFPKKKETTAKGGRPGHSTRDILDGVLWVLRVGARWNDLPTPKGFPSGTTCYRHFRKWVEDGIFDKVIRALIDDLRERGKINLAETFIDATFVEAKKGGQKSVKPSPARALKSWQSWTIDLFLSHCLLKVLHQQRVDLLSQRFGPAIHGTYLSDLSETKLTIVILSGMSFGDLDVNSYLPTAEIDADQKLKMADLYDVTDEDGWSNDSFPGFSPFEE